METLGGNKLAVDASIWIYQFLKTTRGAGKKNAHLVGFFRRILKLLFLGIKPVFVFDGVAPELKRKTVARRRERREGRIDGMEKEAKRILAVQLEARDKRSRDGESDDDVSGSHLLDAESAKPAKKKLKSDYDLPDLDVIVGADDRFLTQRELEEREELRNLIPHVSGDGSLDISTSIDFDSDYFKALPDATKYELLNNARLRSRLRMGHTADQLQQLYPDSATFSHFQINRVAQRNNYTQRLMQLVGMQGDLTLPKEDETEAGINRVSGEKDKLYKMEKNDQGWTLAMHDGGVNWESAIDVDEDGEKRGHDFGHSEVKREVGMEREIGKFQKSAQKFQKSVKKEEDSEEEDWEDVDITQEVGESKGNDFHQDRTKTGDLGSKNETKNASTAIFGDISDSELDEALQTSIMNSLDADKQKKLQMMTKQLQLHGVQGLGEMDWGGGIFATEQDTLREQEMWSRDKVEEVKSRDAESSKALPLVEDEDVAEAVEEQARPHVTADKANKPESVITKPAVTKPADSLPSWFNQNSIKSAYTVITKDNEESDSDEEAGLYYGKSRDVESRDVIELSDDEITKPEEKETVVLSDSDDAEFESVPLESHVSDPVSKQDHVSELTNTVSQPLTNETPLGDLSGGIFGTGPLDLGGLTEPEQMSKQDFESRDTLGKQNVELTQPESDSAGGDEAAPGPSESIDAVSKSVSELTNREKSLSQQPESGDDSDPDESFSNMILAEEEAVFEMQKSKTLMTNLSREQDSFEQQFKLEEDAAREMRMALMEELEQLSHTQKSRDSTNEETITQTMIDECQQLLQLFGIPFITAPTEAEAQCATLVNLDLVDGVITEDSDVFLFSSSKKMRVFKNFFNSNKYVECYKSGEIEQVLNLERTDLVDLALLLGSDYTDGLPGIGPVSAMEILAEFKAPGKDTLREFKTWWDGQLGEKMTKKKSADDSAFKQKFSKRFRTKLFLNASFPSEKIRQGYLAPSIDDDTTPFKWGHPSLIGLREYLGDTIGGSSIDSLLLPVLQQMNQKQNKQTQILDYLPNGNETQGSVRIEKALKKIQQRAKEKRGERMDKGKEREKE